MVNVFNITTNYFVTLRAKKKDIKNKYAAHDYYVCGFHYSVC